MRELYQIKHLDAMTCVCYLKETEIIGRVLFLADFVNGSDRYRHQFGGSLKSLNATGSECLTELLDGLILLYHVGVHKHYLKVSFDEAIQIS